MQVQKIIKCFVIFLCVLTCALHNRAQAQVFHITTIHCGLGKDDVTLLNRMAKFEAKFYNTVFNTSINDSLPINVYLYGRRTEFDAVQRVPHSTFFDGFFSPSENRITVMKTDRYLPTLLHETSHNLLHNNLNNPPRWLNEGIAMIFENLRDQNNEIYFSPQYGRIKLVKDLMFAHKFEFGNFFNAPDSYWFDNKAQVDYMYAVSYCVIYYFVKFDLESLSNMLSLMKQGYTTFKAITQVFGSFDNFQHRFMDFYKPAVDYRP